MKKICLAELIMLIMIYSSVTFMVSVVIPSTELLTAIIRYRSNIYIFLLNKLFFNNNLHLIKKPKTSANFSHQVVTKIIYLFLTFGQLFFRKR
jgi:hypothetical protein